MNIEQKMILNCLSRPEVETLPGISLPVYPRSVGYFRKQNELPEKYPARHFVQLYWGISGSGILRRNGRDFTVGPGDVFFYYPEDPHFLRAENLPWIYRWITFDGSEAEHFIRSYGYPENSFHAGKCPEELFEAYASLLREMTPFAWREMVGILCRILAAAGGGTEEEHSPHGQLAAAAAEFCRNHFQDPFLNVDMLAGQLKISRSTLRRIFQKQIRSSPSEYLMKVRMQHALTLLHLTHLPLKETAERCGFSDPAYFSRVIRKHFGKTPSEIRREIP